MMFKQYSGSSHLSCSSLTKMKARLKATPFTEETISATSQTEKPTLRLMITYYRDRYNPYTYTMQYILHALQETISVLCTKAQVSGFI